MYKLSICVHLEIHTGLETIPYSAVTNIKSNYNYKNKQILITRQIELTTDYVLQYTIIHIYIHLQ